MRRWAGVVAGAIVAAAVLSGCAAGTGDDGAAVTPTAIRTEKPSVADLVTPTPTASAPSTAEPLAQTVDAGALAEGAPAIATGTGPSNVTYQRQGEFAVVIQLDCSQCTGTATVTAPGRMSPFGEAAAPSNGSFLMDVFQNASPDQMLIVDAQGPWTVTLASWNDLPYVSGPQSGVGPAVLFFSDDVGHVQVDYAPSGPDDSFSGRVFTTSANPQIFGNDEAFSEVFEADLPGVMAIQTNGTWTVTPTP